MVPQEGHIRHHFTVYLTDTSETVHTYNPTLSVRDKTVIEFQKTIQ